MTRSILTFSRLYPSSAFPQWGPFVHDEVVALASRNRVAVVAPLPWPTRHLAEIRAVARVPREMDEDGVLVVRPRLPGIPVATHHLEPWLWAAVLPSVLRRVYRAIGADLVHSHFALPDGFAGARFASRSGAPHVLTIRGSDVLVLGRRPALRRLLRWTFERTDAIIAVSTELAERAVDMGASSDRIRVLPGGIPYRDVVLREATRDVLGVPQDVTCLVWVGRLVDVKDPLGMIDAFARFFRAARGPSILVMIGEGDLRGKVEDRVRSYGLEGSVRLLGYLSRGEVWQWECAADVLVSSSRSEGAGMAVIEAMGAGTPAAAYPNPGTRDVMQTVSGGAVARDRTPAALAQAIREALSTTRSREELATAARSVFAIDVAAREIERVYDAVV